MNNDRSIADVLCCIVELNDRIGDVHHDWASCVGHEISQITDVTSRDIRHSATVISSYSHRSTCSAMTPDQYERQTYRMDWSGQELQCSSVIIPRHRWRECGSPSTRYDLLQSNGELRSYLLFTGIQWSESSSDDDWWNSILLYKTQASDALCCAVGVESRHRFDATLTQGDKDRQQENEIEEHVYR